MKKKPTLAVVLTMEQLEQIGTRSTQTCPTCGRTLWEIISPAPLQFRCGDGHAFTLDALLQERSMRTEQALWAAIRALHEKKTLLIQLATEARQHNRIALANEYEVHANAVSEQDRMMRQLVTGL
jgi:two-component system chemotaxis response regulator CheB